jgi:acyl-CoA dehydrogenase
MTMSEQQQLIVETSRRIFSDLCTKEVVDRGEAGEWAQALWHALETSGLTLAGIAEDAGGSGGDVADALLVIRQAAEFAAPIPLAENFIAATLLVEAGIELPAGPLTVAGALECGTIEFSQQGSATDIVGDLAPVSFGLHCNHWVIVAENEIAVVSPKALNAAPMLNIAGESESIFPSGTSIGSIEALNVVKLNGASERLRQLGAITRVNLMCGAMTSILDMSVAYALERKQFGRAISQFQAVQQQLAILAGEVASCQRAADSILNSDAVMDIAIAKARVGEAVQKVADISHQVHGAMGYTREHPLNLRTRRLWVWRDQYGKETYWQQQLARTIVARGADALWDVITRAN